MNTTSDYFNYDLLSLVSSITITTITLICNSIVLLIFSKKTFRNQPFIRYLFVCTIFDTICALIVWPSNYPDFFLINELDISCKLAHYINDVSIMISAWIDVIAALEILLLSKYPKRFNWRKIFKNQVIIILILIAISCLLMVPDLVFALVDVNAVARGCGALYAGSLNLYLAVMEVFLPFVCMMVINVLTFFELIKTKISSKNVLKAKRLFKVSVSLNLLFFISNIPQSCYYLYSSILNITPEGLLSIIFNLLSYFYFSLDFFVYLLANRLFREHVSDLLKCCKFCRKGTENKRISVRRNATIGNNR